MKGYQFLKICTRFEKKEKKHSYSSQWEEMNWEKLGFAL